MKRVALIALSVAVGIAVFFTAPSLFQSSQNSSTVIKQVENEYVCMVNDRYFDRQLIEVPVGGKTYYGCCQGCVSNLKNNPEIRTATDPVTGKEVDKATATIGVLTDGTVHYFESEETLTRYDTSTVTN